LAWAAGAGRQLWTFRVVDRFGDAGLTGLLGLEKRGDEVHAADFVLSCRVMGRQIEQAILHWATLQAQEMGGRSLHLHYAATKKNSACLDVLQHSALERCGDRFYWLSERAYPLPSHVQLKI
jgi:FkbH-like protein